MKFAKLLQRTTELGDSSWNEYWIDYKGLKKLLGDIQERPTARPELASEEDVAAVLAKSPTEIAFFTKLRAELTKVSAFFLSQESGMASQYQDVMVEADRIKKSKTPVPKEETVQLVRRTVEFYMQLIMLENFAVMNYCGFGKILKKHDKRTGFLTKRKFMRRMVDPQEFAHYPRLLRMLTQTETTYKRLVSVLPPETRRGLAQASTENRFRQLATVKAAGTMEKRAHSEADLAGLAKRHDASGSAAATGTSSAAAGEPPRKKASIETPAGSQAARATAPMEVAQRGGPSGQSGAIGQKRARASGAPASAAGWADGTQAHSSHQSSGMDTAASTGSQASSAPQPAASASSSSSSSSSASSSSASSSSQAASAPGVTSASPVLSSRGGTAADAQLAAEALLGVGLSAMPVTSAQQQQQQQPHQHAGERPRGAGAGTGVFAQLRASAGMDSGIARGGGAPARAGGLAARSGSSSGPHASGG